MTARLADRVKETSTTTGTGTLNLDGAVSGFQTFVAGIGTGNTCYYAIVGGAEWEVGIGTVTDASPDTLSRTTILASSNSGSVVTLSAGTKDVFCTAPASRITPGNVLYDSGALGADASSIDTGASGVAGGYSILQIYTLLRTDETSEASGIACLFNNDSGGNYDRQYLDAGSTTVAAAGLTGQTSMAFSATGASATANYFGIARMTVPFYSETTAYKSATIYGSMITPAKANNILQNSYVWKNTAAITRVSFAPITAGKKFKAGSHVLILGIG